MKYVLAFADLEAVSFTEDNLILVEENIDELIENGTIDILQMSLDEAGFEFTEDVVWLPAAESTLEVLRVRCKLVSIAELCAFISFG